MWLIQKKIQCQTWGAIFSSDNSEIMLEITALPSQQYVHNDKTTNATTPKYESGKVINNPSAVIFMPYHIQNHFMQISWPEFSKSVSSSLWTVGKDNITSTKMLTWHSCIYVLVLRFIILIVHLQYLLKEWTTKKNISLLYRGSRGSHSHCLYSHWDQANNYQLLTTLRCCWL